MIVTEREKCIYGRNVEIVSRESDCTVYRLADETGEITMTSYSVFPGIELIYNNVHMQSRIKEDAKPASIFEINHCREGRIECEFEDEFLYLTPGDLAIACRSNTGHGSYFPLSHYYGISIIIDIEKTPKCLSCFLDDVDVEPENLMKKFSTGSKCYVQRSNASIEHIFSELYSVPDDIKKGYFKIKILELLLFLSGMDLQQDLARSRYVSASQVILAKKVCRYMTDHMYDRVTLEELTQIFHFSGTQIKNSFKAVYGTSVYAYIRGQKMQAAAIMLRDTQLSILEIAGRFGYDNGSKFAKAFCDVIGVTPSEYRRREVV